MRAGALSWYNQLPKDDRKDWTYLSSRFWKQYCVDQGRSAQSKYHQAKRGADEHLLDYLLRLNGLARKARIPYQGGGESGIEHVRRFLESCRSESVSDYFFPLGLDDISKVETMLQEKLIGERRLELSEMRKRTTRSPTGRDSSTRNMRPGSTAAKSSSAWDSGHGYRQPRWESARNVWSEDEGSESGEEARMMQDEYGEYFSEHRLSSAAGPSDRRSGPTSGNPGGFRDRSRDRGYYPDQRDRPRDRGYERESRDYPRDRGYDRDPRGRTPSGTGPPPGSTCAACGGSNHTADRCYRRCRFCGQVHAPGQCEKNQQLQTVLEYLKSAKIEDLPAKIRDIAFQEN